MGIQRVVGSVRIQGTNLAHLDFMACLVEITGDDGRLPRDITRNTATVAAQCLVERFAPGASIELELHKGLPLGSGLGSSGASACAAAVAVDGALGLGLGVEPMIEAARTAEAVACGTPHPDNVAPCLAGGLVLIPALDPLRIVHLPVPEQMWLSVYTPGCEVPTKRAREVLPHSISLDQSTQRAARLGLLVHALHEADLPLLGEAIVDVLVEPARAPLIPGFLDAKAACMEAGAIACTISGAGPTTFAISGDEQRAAALLELLDEAFTLAGVPGDGRVDRVGPGARVETAPLH
jgi:homoserine kinase